ncbi:MAG: response regulator [Desulfobacteria bacterium]
MDTPPIKVLLIDDDHDDYVILRDLFLEIEVGKFRLEWVETYDAAIERMVRNEYDVCLVDYLLGERNGLELLNEAVKNGCKTPMILLTGKGAREVDMAAMKAGASDYLDKGEIGPSLLERSIRYAIERKRTLEEQIRLISQLQEALAHVKQLSGLLPMCASCKKIRDDKGYWNQLEAYISDHSEADFSHGICPECVRKLYPEYAHAFDAYEKSKRKST